MAAVVAAAYVESIRLVRVRPRELALGVPTIWGWVRRAFPPATGEIGVLSYRAAQTAAIALVGTSIAAVLALLVCLPAARNVSRNPLVRLPARLLLNGLRGIDSFVFALLFVVAVGLGPFAGVLGIAFHTWGSMGKLFSETIEGLPRGPMEAAELTGASRFKVALFTTLRDAMPGLASVGLYLLEFNVRASTVLGIVGAGGIGQDLKNSLDLLDFPRLATIVAVILVMVTAIDQLSSALRRSLG
ncbi:MAG: phosphonate ABC transporter, permease protein PhnE [Acidimicrobiales bacterium]